MKGGRALSVRREDFLKCDGSQSKASQCIRSETRCHWPPRASYWRSFWSLRERWEDVLHWNPTQPPQATTNPSPSSSAQNQTSQWMFAGYQRPSTRSFTSQGANTPQQQQEAAILWPHWSRFQTEPFPFGNTQSCEYVPMYSGTIKSSFLMESNDPK